MRRNSLRRSALTRPRRPKNLANPAALTRSSRSIYGRRRRGSSGVFKVKVEGMPEGTTIRVQTGPAINGTEVRDATGTVDFGQFTNQIEYQDAGSALNNEVKSQVIGELDREKLQSRRSRSSARSSLRSIPRTGW